MAAKTICDTMIWYYFGNGKLDENVYADDILTVTFINVHEVATSFNLIRVMDDVRSAIRKMMTLSKETKFDPPLIHLAKLANPEMEYDTLKDNSSIFEATRLIAKGHDIEDSKIAEFESWLNEREKPLEEFSRFTNDKLIEIRARIRNKKEHSKEDATNGNRQLISTFVEITTNGRYNLNNLDWSQVELFDNVLHTFYKELELSGNMTFQPNDLFDLLMLVYVQPEDFYFTMEKRWITRIKNARMEKYLR
jgi:hypothetical protein